MLVFKGSFKRKAACLSGMFLHRLTHLLVGGGEGTWKSPGDAAELFAPLGVVSGHVCGLLDPSGLSPHTQA